MQPALPLPPRLVKARRDIKRTLRTMSLVQLRTPSQVIPYYSHQSSAQSRTTSVRMTHHATTRPNTYTYNYALRVGPTEVQERWFRRALSQWKKSKEDRENLDLQNPLRLGCRIVSRWELTGEGGVREQGEWVEMEYSWARNGLTQSIMAAFLDRLDSRQPISLGHAFSLTGEVSSRVPSVTGELLDQEFRPVKDIIRLDETEVKSIRQSLLRSKSFNVARAR